MGIPRIRWIFLSALFICASSAAVEAAAWRNLLSICRARLALLRHQGPANLGSDASAELVWETPQPEDFFRNFDEPQFQRLERGTIIHVPNMDQRLTWNVGHEEHLTVNTPYEKLLITQSRALRGSPEVAHARVLDRFGNPIWSSPEFVWGTGTSVGRRETLALEENLEGLNHPEAFIIEFSHVHPRYEYSFREKKGSKYSLTYPPTEPDVDALLCNSGTFSLVVRERVILPNGYSYVLHGRRGSLINSPGVSTQVLAMAGRVGTFGFSDSMQISHEMPNLSAEDFLYIAQRTFEETVLHNLAVNLSHLTPPDLGRIADQLSKMDHIDMGSVTSGIRNQIQRNTPRK